MAECILHQRQADVSNGPRSLSRNPPDCIIFGHWVFDNFISFDELFTKILQRLATCLSVDKELYEKIFASVPIMSNGNLPNDFFSVDFSLFT